jgi:threonine dehydrogenase-like Zn-dependent dehydrogenase
MLRDADPPALPGGHWVRVRTLLGGVCGTDLAILAQKQPPDSMLQAYSSMPMGLGHENVAVVEEIGTEVDSDWLGRRVNVEPTLCCAPRGISPPCDRCRNGEFGACEHFGDEAELGILPAGSSIGYNARTGGAFSEYFVAHVSQLVPVPEGVLDELAVLVDPAACSLHAVLRADLGEAQQVLVYGAGVLGLAAIAGLRAVGYAGRIDAIDVAKYLEPVARRLGADQFIRLPSERPGRFERVAELTGARIKRARFGNLTLAGGYDVIFDCVGSDSSFNESLKWSRNHGQVVLVGTASGGKLELTPLWFYELTVLGAYGRQIEMFGGRRIGTYQLVQELMAQGRLPLGGLLTHTFRIEQYRSALAAAMDKHAHQAIKVAFDFRPAAG